MPFEPLSTSIPQVKETFKDLMTAVQENMEDNQHYDPMAPRKVVLEIEIVPKRPDHSELAIHVSGAVKLPKKLAKAGTARRVAGGLIQAWLDEEFQEEIPTNANVRVFAGGRDD